MEKAAIKLGELNSFSKLVPTIDLFIQLHVTKEAVVSSRIEGTQTQMDEALMDEDEIAPERKDDWIEVNNYIKSLNTAIERLEKLPISSRLLRETHQILLDSVRGEHRLPGEFRSSQNWIDGNSLSDAIFIPPHQDYVGELMSDLENFIHNEDIDVPELVKIAIAHYQFETIHPFLDGNGRIGRLLITLFLVDKKILTKPLLYLSAYFEKNKGLYYDNLTFVRTKNDMKQWLKYFLVGIAETAEKASQTLSNVLELKERLENKINNDFGRKSQNAIILLQYLLKKPIINVNQAKDVTGLTYNTANSLISDFIDADFLKEVTGYSRNRVFIFDEYLKLFYK
ncbi:Fic family protein [Tunicatimonas pelagia]|uniref:Fic family protein n=1 Tax=Tunicatimonas pelagia TaxID=931531 RepID=UPI002666BAE1|nr:Fic family protein [Tunicatimonas pelagia]WKN45019.1 Fic family protein [Tunicatimonas pelagia]